MADPDQPARSDPSPSSSSSRVNDLDMLDPPDPDAGADHFDRLPDSLLLVIFNLIGDVKALGRCSLASRRFHSLVPLVDSVVVRVDCVISDDPNSSSSSASSPNPHSSVRFRGVFSNLARLVLGGIVKPIQALGQILASTNNSSATCRLTPSGGPSTSTSPSSPASSDVPHHSPSEVLRNFKELRSLKIELPAGELGVDDGVLLKWRADFGSTIGSCVILGAASFGPKVSSPASSSGDGDGDGGGGW